VASVTMMEGMHAFRPSWGGYSSISNCMWLLTMLD
jgi:hypothetical protein